MPAAICHKIHAEKVLFALSDKLSINEDAFYWGAQGPDFFFCHRYLPWMPGDNIRYLGNKIHESGPNWLINAMYELCRDKNDVVLLSYFYGFICHYSFDSIAHPYINFRAKEMNSGVDTAENESVIHNEIESNLDTIVLRFEKELLPSEFNLKTAFPHNLIVMKKIAILWSKLISEVFDINIDYSVVLQSERDAITVFRLLGDKTALKRKLFQKIGKSDISCHIRPFFEEQEPDYANLSHKTYNETEKDFFELMNEAKEKALRIIGGIGTENIELLTENKAF